MRHPSKETELAALPNVVPLALDITDPQQIGEAASATLARGDVDVAFNNAGYGMAGPLEGVTDEQMRRMVHTNLMGPIRVTKAFMPHFREKRRGLFINTTSLRRLITVPLNSMCLDEVGARRLEPKEWPSAASIPDRPEDHRAWRHED